jgi:ABC-type antimicrobial peptide transport system permease subunit
MAFVVARRNKELGIRLALGATRGGVLWIVMREVLTLLGIGLGVGGFVAVVAGFIVDRYLGLDIGLYNVKLHDPYTAIATLLLLATAAALAGLIPAQRASRINPIQTLRYE